MLYTIQQIADRWDCHRRTVKKEMEKGKLKYFTFGSQERPQYRIREDWLREYEESGGRSEN